MLQSMQKNVIMALDQENFNECTTNIPRQRNVLQTENFENLYHTRLGFQLG